MGNQFVCRNNKLVSILFVRRTKSNFVRPSLLAGARFPPTPGAFRPLVVTLSATPPAVLTPRGDAPLTLHPERFLVAERIREKVLRETRNDHQLATARRFGERPGVVVVWEERELPEGLERLRALVNAAPGVAEPALREGPLFDVIRDFMDTGARSSRGPR